MQERLTDIHTFQLMEVTGASSVFHQLIALPNCTITLLYYSSVVCK